MITIDTNTNINKITFIGETEVNIGGSQLVFVDDLTKTQYVVDAEITRGTAPWIKIDVSGSDLPQQKGFYTVQVNEVTGTGDLIWGSAVISWNQLRETWLSPTYSNIEEVISNLKVFVEHENIRYQQTVGEPIVYNEPNYTITYRQLTS